jgi:hypothetical protein
MKRIVVLAAIVSALVFGQASTVHAATDCSFDMKGSTMRLAGDCTTDETIFIPDGYTLDGRGHTITAVDPDGGHFVGAVVQNGGAVAHVTKLTVTVDGLVNVCDAGDDRLRGIMFEGASGSITHSTVTGVNQGPSGCQEGNSIEIRNAPFDGTHPNTQVVEIAHNTIADFQKTGIVANGDVDVHIHHNTVGESATQDDLAANSIQLGFGALGTVAHNDIAGNQWKGTSDFAATAILVYEAGAGVEVSHNRIGGNSDIGIYFFADNGIIDHNKVHDEGPDDPNSGYDIGIGNWGAGNNVNKNRVRGFEVPFDPPELAETNRVLPD